MKSIRKSTYLTDEGVAEILSASQAAMERRKFSTDEVESYLERVGIVLDLYREHLGEGIELAYRFKRHFGRVELRLVLLGERLNPREWEREQEQEETARAIERVLGPLVRNQFTTVSHAYVQGRNIVAITSPRREGGSLLRSPMLWAPILGLVLGLLCLQLPEGIRMMVVNDVAKPVQSLIFMVMAGVTIPVTFLSLICAISALNNISQLTDLGFKTFGRFVVVTLLVMAVGIGVSLVFYSAIGDDGSDFQASQIIEILLGIIPTNVLSPLVEGNVPQLVVLAVGLGAALLLLEEQGMAIRDALTSINEWLLSLMDIVMTIVPAIPFVSIFVVVAEGSGAELLRGWEFIVATYVAAIICGAAKIIKVSHKYKVSIKTLWTKFKPMVSKAFSTGSSSSVLREEYEVSKHSLGINPEYSAFWIPMSNAMLNPSGTLMFVIPSFLILKYTGMPVTISFMVMLVIMVLELSMASPGTTGGWVILFGALGFSDDFVGMFLTYKLAVNNFCAGYCVLHCMLEHIESAYGNDSIDLESLRAA